MFNFLYESKFGEWLAGPSPSKDPFEDAVRKGELAQCSRCMVDGTVNLEKRNCYDDTYLHVAVQNGHLEVVKLLVDAGTIVNVKGNGGNSPLHVAAVNGKRDIAEYLIANGASVHLKNNANQNAYDTASLASMRQYLLSELFPRKAPTQVTSHRDSENNKSTKPAGGRVVSTIDYGNADGFGTSHYNDVTNANYVGGNPWEVDGSAHKNLPPPPPAAISVSSNESSTSPSPPFVNSMYADRSSVAPGKHMYVSYFGNPTASQSPGISQQPNNAHSSGVGAPQATLSSSTPPPSSQADVKYTSVGFNNPM